MRKAASTQARARAEDLLQPVRRHGGYVPIADHGLIGDGATAALVDRSGAVTWLCAPRFDSPPVFASLLDAGRGGAFAVSLTGERVDARQMYVPGTGVLETELRDSSGAIRITDALTLRHGVDLRADEPAERGELVRSVRVLAGSPRVRVAVRPRDGAQWQGGPCEFVLPPHGAREVALALRSSHELAAAAGELELEAGERAWLILSWTGFRTPRDEAGPGELLERTVAGWRRWSEQLDYDGPWAHQVRRSAITLKLLDNIENGALVAAPTSSLPERIGGMRNWDYRYSWVRDAAFSVFAMRRVGMAHEGIGFLHWVLEAIDRGQHPRVLYDLDGHIPGPEHEDSELEGYRRSRPVRWGNAAVEQDQHDVYGEIVDCAYQWVGAGGEIGAEGWQRLVPLIAAAAREWDEPDHGIWEVRSTAKPFTYSAAMCHVALDRGSRLAERLDLPGDPAWRAGAERIVTGILRDAWDPDRKTLTDHLGGGGVDGALLALPVRRVVPADHPKMVATCRAAEQRLDAGEGLLYRYRQDELPDGLPGDEGAFLMCSFWLAQSLALAGEVDRAASLFESLCGRTNAIGLLPEQIDPASGDFLGNFPQALSHVGLIATAITLERRLGDGAA